MAKKPIKKFLVLIVGLLFLVVGIVTAIIPLIPGGFILIPFGLVLLALLFPKVDAFIDRLVRKWPKLHGAMEKAERRVERFVGSLE